MQVVRLGALCNNACVFCAQAHERVRGAAPDAVASEDRLLAAISVAAATRQSLAFVGGEPTLHENLPKWIARAREAGVREIVVQSNARMLAYSSYARDLRAAGLTSLDVSLLGSTSPMHDYHTGTPGSFVQTVRGMRNAKAVQLTVVASCLVTRSNFRALPDIVRVAHAAGATAMRFRFPAPVGRAAEAPSRLTAHPALVEPYLKQAWTQAQRLRMDGFALGPSRDPQLGFVEFIADDAEHCLQHQAGDEASVGRIEAEVLVGRARPAVTERRVRERRTGSELQAILPELFPTGSGER